MTGDVGRVDGARRAGGTERALRQTALVVAREDRAPVLELVDVPRSLAGKDLDRVLIAEVVRPLDGIERVLLGTVLRGVAERCVDAALGCTGVAADRVQLLDDGDVGADIVGLDRGAHAGEAGADDDDIVVRVHEM